MSLSMAEGDQDGLYQAWQGPAAARRAGSRHPRKVATARSSWGSAYQVSYAAGKLRAYRRDGGAGLPAGSAEDLHDLIVADYEARKVPREFDVPAQ
jgi:hypothetical protein